VITITNACISYFSIAHGLVRMILAAEKRNHASQFELSLTTEKKCDAGHGATCDKERKYKSRLDLLTVVGI